MSQQLAQVPEEPRPPRPFQARSRNALAALALLGVGIIVYVASNVAIGLLLGVVMAFVAEPLYSKASIWFRGYRRPAALLTTVAVLTGLAVSAVFTAWLVANESVAVAVDVQRRASGASLEAIVGRGGVRLVRWLHISEPWVLTRLREGAERVQELAAPILAGVASSSATWMFTGVIAFATMYYALFQWEGAARYVEALLPIRPRYTRMLLEEFKVMGRSAFLGTIGTALCQGGFAALGFAVAGAPRPALLGLLSVFLSFLPVGGTMLVWLPASLYLIADDRIGAGVGLLVWSILVVVTLSDYVIRPRLVGRARPVHPLFVLVALFGGVETFGLWGVIMGPVMMSLCVAVVRMYAQEFAPNRVRITEHG